jgi:hypothetical protein
MRERQRLECLAPIEQHLFLILDAQLLVFIPAGNDELVLYRANVEQLIEKAKH